MTSSRGTENLQWTADAALINLDGCTDDLRDLIEIWLRQTPQLVSEIRAGLDAANADRVHLAVHTLKGSLQILSGGPVTRTAEALERAADSADLSACRTLSDRLCIELEVLTPQVTAWYRCDEASGD